MRLRKLIPALPTVVAAAMALLAAALVPLLPAYAQSIAGSCTNGTAVPDWANNPGLVSDCEALLSARDTLAGTGSLNWSVDTPIGEWEGVILGLESPHRVIGLPLTGRNLTGTISPALRGLSRLRWLRLGDNRLTGEIPGELTNLTALEALSLFNNRLTGGIPPELGSLRNLRSLILSHNQLSGEIPGELGGLANLESLGLSGNRLVGGIPPELGSLANLQELSLSHNQLTGEPPEELSHLSRLRWLNLRSNQLSGPVPSWVVRLTNLESLWLSSNQLAGEIPPELASHPTLRLLELGDNPLTGRLPAELGSLSSLERLYIWGTHVMGEIPATLGSLANLEQLGLWDNRLSGEIPPELGNLTNLITIELGGNQLSGMIPEELANLSKLEKINLSPNRFTGCIPGRLRAVERNFLLAIGLPFCDVLLDDLVVSPGSLVPPFDRHHTDYTVEVSTPNVTIHPISRYDATFEPLDEAGHEVADADVALPGIQIDAGAAFRGIRIKVVTVDGKATRTYTIGIRRVLGAPTIGAVEAGGGYLAVSWAAPDEFAEARTASYDLRYIPTAADETVDTNWTVVENVPTYSTGGNLQYTITGLSAGTQYEVQLRAVNRNGKPVAWSASVTGTPTTPSVCVIGGAVTAVIAAGIISDCESLLAARDALAGNGSLNWSPSTPIKDWDGVTVGGTPPRVVGLSVNSRALDGTIPAGLGDLTGLQRLHLLENRLTGPIPAELGKLANLQSLDLGENRLTGQIPVDLARLSNLRSLDLSDNRLTGEIPSQLGRLAELQDLLLQRNGLAGVIPSQLGDLDNLVEVDLSGNNLRGCAPPIPNALERGGPPCFAAEGMAFTVDTSFLLAGDGLRIASVGDASNGVVTLDGTTITYRHDGSETTTGGFTYTSPTAPRPPHSWSPSPSSRSMIPPSA